MLGARFMDGSGAVGRTFHAEGPNHGWFDIKQRNLPCWRPVSWMVQVLEANLPCWRSISWMVQYEITEPSTLEVDIMEGSAAKGEPSTLEANIVDGSI